MLPSTSGLGQTTFARLTSVRIRLGVPDLEKGFVVQLANQKP